MKKRKLRLKKEIKIAILNEILNIGCITVFIVFMYLLSILLIG